jgi:hypothetical protein
MISGRFFVYVLSAVTSMRDDAHCVCLHSMLIGIVNGLRDPSVDLAVGSYLNHPLAMEIQGDSYVCTQSIYTSEAE